MCSSVLLPQPLGPVIATDSASLISSDTLAKGLNVAVGEILGESRL